MTNDVQMGCATDTAGARAPVAIAPPSRTLGGYAATSPSAQPWPSGHVPSGLVEREMWAAFAAISRKQGARLSLSAVARHSGHSRTMISHDGGDFRALRDAILAEIARRKPAKVAKPTREEVEAIAEARREHKVNHWRAVAREADGRNAECMAATVAAETRTERAHGVLRRILDDMVAGRWVRADPSAVLLGEIEVLLGSPVRTVAGDADDVAG